MAVKKFKIDSYKVCKYEDIKFEDIVELVEVVDKKYVICYSPKYKTNVLIPKNELMALDK